MVSNDNRPSSHSGPLGLAGWGAILGAGGLLAWAGFGMGGETADPVNGDTGGDVVIVRPVGPDTGPVDNPVDHGSGTPDPTDPIDLPDTGETPIIKPIPPIGPEGQPVKPPVVPPVHTQSEPYKVVLIVKVKDSPEFERAIKLHRKDKTAAEEAFQAFIRKNPEFKGMKLVRGSYSGEARLEYTFPKGRDANQQAIKTLQARLKAANGVAYADLDYIVHPSKED